MGYIYLIYDTTSIPEKFKVGITKNDVEKRRKQLSTGSSSMLTILRVYESDMYKKIETILHRMYISYCTDGGKEWFALPNDRALNFINDCKKIEDNINQLKKDDNPFI